MTLLQIASQNNMTVTELKTSIISKVKILEAMGMSRKEAEQKVKEIFFASLKGE